MLTDERLISAAGNVAMCILDSYPPPTHCSHTFSEQFERKMDKLFRKVNHPILYRSIRYAACILLTLTLVFGSVLAFSPQARAYVGKWIKQKYESFYQYFFVGDVYSETPCRYELSFVPDGYSLIDSYEDSSGEAFIYANEIGQILQFTYMTNSNSSSLFVEAEEYIQKKVLVHSLPGEVYISKEENHSNGIIWTDDTSGTLFFISGNLQEADLISIAQQVVKK